MKTLLAICLLLAACSTPTAPPPVSEDRYLSLEEDNYLRDKCAVYEPVGGCIFLPLVDFQRLLRDLAAARGGRGT